MEVRTHAILKRDSPELYWNHGSNPEQKHNYFMKIPVDYPFVPCITTKETHRSNILKQVTKKEMKKSI